MGRRQTKRRYLDSLKFRVMSKQLKPEQAKQFQLLFARCRTAAQFKQVADVLHEFCRGPAGRTDRYGVLMRDESLELA